MGRPSHTAVLFFIFTTPELYYIYIVNQYSQTELSVLQWYAVVLPVASWYVFTFSPVNVVNFVCVCARVCGIKLPQRMGDHFVTWLNPVVIFVSFSTLNSEQDM